MTTGPIMRASCHCGTVLVEFELIGSLHDMSRCDCSLCRRVKPAAVTSRVGELQVLDGEAELRLYQFGTKTAKHWFCGICGTHTHHQRRSNPEEYGINVGCLLEVDPRLAGQAEWVEGVNHPSDAPAEDGPDRD